MDKTPSFPVRVSLFKITSVKDLSTIRSTSHGLGINPVPDGVRVRCIEGHGHMVVYGARVAEGFLREDQKMGTFQTFQRLYSIDA